MNWVDPRITPPEQNRIYLVLWEFNNTKVVGIATAKFAKKYNSKTGEWEPRKDKAMIWESLYSQARTKAATFNGELTSEYKMLKREEYYANAFLELIPNGFPLRNAIAYIAIKDIDYPKDLIENASNCTCGKKNNPVEE